MQGYSDRQQAGKELAKALGVYANREDVIVLALPRGGVPVAYEIAQTLNVVLDVFIVRKLGVPGHLELAMGAIASGDVMVFNNEIKQNLHLSETAINDIIKREQAELARREQLYRGGHPFPELLEKTIILVDDGIATGATMHVAVKALRQFKPAKIIVAVPVAEVVACKRITELVDQMVCPLEPSDFDSVGAWFADFDQLTDKQVALYLSGGYS